MIIYRGLTLAAETHIRWQYRIYIGKNTLIGAISVIVGRDNKDLNIIYDAIIRENSAVTRGVPNGVTVAGAPARILN